MSNNTKNSYIPDFLVTPGEVLQDYLDDVSMTQAELAARTGLTPKTINEIIKAKSPITPETALKLERVLGRPAHFWSTLERQYQDDLARLSEQKRMESHLAWLKKVPTAPMAKQGWIPAHKDKADMVAAVLCFFGVASPEQWKTVWTEYQVAFRQTERFEKCAEAVSAWLRQGELEAQKIVCGPYDKKGFLEALQRVRALTVQPPAVFGPELVSLCAAVGVAVVFVPELPGTGTWGATRWLGEHAVIQLSLRYKSNDHLWFTFFHEAGHIIKHGRKDVIIESNDHDDAKEQEANKFAQDILIPPAALQRLIKRGRPTLAAVEAFAREINIAPGIVVGRLQHEKIFDKHVGNYLKESYSWTKAETE